MDTYAHHRIERDRRIAARVAFGIIAFGICLVLAIVKIGTA